MPVLSSPSSSSNRDYVAGRVMSSNVSDTVESGFVSVSCGSNTLDLRLEIVPYGEFGPVLSSFQSRTNER